MRKVFIGVLAALMLFAFVACDNNAPQAPLMGNQIEGVELVSVPDYLYGEKIDPAKVQLNVVKNDGSKIAYTGTELQMDAVTLNADTTAVAVTYAGLTFYVNVPAYEPELITFNISGIKATTISLGASDKLDITGTTVTATYDGGKIKDITEAWFAANDQEINAKDVLALFENPKAGTTITVSSAVLPTEVVEVKGINYTLSGSKTLTVAEAAKAAELSDVTLAQVYAIDDTVKEVFNVGTQNKISDAAIKVVYTLKTAAGTDTKTVYYGTGTSVKLSDVDTEAKTATTLASGDVLIVLQNYKTSYPFSTSKSSVSDILATVKVKYGSESGDVVEIKDVPLTITAIADYPKSFKAVKVKTTGEENTPVKTVWTWNEPIKPTDFTFEVNEWTAPGVTYSETNKAPELEDAWTATPEKIRENTQKNASFPVTFTYSGYLGSVADKTLTASGTINVDVPK